MRKQNKKNFRCSFILLFFLISALAEAQPPQMPSPQIPAEIPEEPVKSVFYIEVKDGLLSVELTDADFGNVIREIAEKTNFKLEISSDVAHKKIGTTFKNVDVEKGIRRMLALIKEKDFTISYNPGGSIDKIEIYGEISKPPVSPYIKKPQVTPRPVSPPPGALPPQPTQPRVQPLRLPQPTQPFQPPQPPQPFQPPQPPVPPEIPALEQ